MSNFLHNFEPNPILLSLGYLQIHWYGLFMVLAMIAGLVVSLRLAKLYKMSPDLVFDLSFWLIIGGLLGARAYEIILMLPFYLANPWQAVRIWEGGLAIHGAIFAGLAIIYYFSQRHKLNFWKLGSILAPGLALGQAIGRWGNYFNQELYGQPSDLPWAIPISLMNRPPEHILQTHFHPAFLYESLGLLLIFAALYRANQKAAQLKKLSQRFFLWSVCFYVISYSILRFILEYVRLDDTPVVLGWRWPQIISLFLIAGATMLLICKLNAFKEKDLK